MATPLHFCKIAVSPGRLGGIGLGCGGEGSGEPGAGGVFRLGAMAGVEGLMGMGGCRMSRRWEKPAVSVRGDRKILTDLAQDNGNCQQVNSSS